MLPPTPERKHPDRDASTPRRRRQFWTGTGTLAAAQAAPAADGDDTVARDLALQRATVLAPHLTETAERHRALRWILPVSSGLALAGGGLSIALGPLPSGLETSNTSAGLRVALTGGGATWMTGGIAGFWAGAPWRCRRRPEAASA